MYLKNFPEKIKFLRLSNNLTQTELATILETTKQAISSYESGKINPSLFALIKLSEHFNISIDSLIFDETTSKNLIDIDSNVNLYNQINIEIKNIRNLQKNLNNLCSYFLKEANKIPNQISEIDYRISKLEKLLYNNFDTNNQNVNNINEEYADELAPNIIDLKSSKKEQIYREIKDFGPIPAGKISLTYEDNIEFVSIPEDNLNSSKGYYVLHISGDSMNKLYKDGEIILVENTSCVAPGDIVIARVGSDATIKRLEIDDEYISLIPESTNPKHKIQTFRHKDICIQGKVIGRLSDYL